MTDYDEVKKALLDKIAKAAAETEHPSHLLELAEAYAWLYSPNQPHGGSAAEK